MAHKRNLAAPFQAKPDAHRHTSNGHSKIEVVDGFVNFRNFSFPPLEKIHELKFNTYCGPTPESNWVIPGVLLVGAYPASEDDEDTFELITSILKNGITKFVCLQSEYQAGVPRLVWRAGGALRPYFEDVQEIVAQKDVIAEFEGHNVVHIDRLLFEHCPIIDCGVTDDSKVVALAQALVKDISEGQVIYLHCWGGHGRTGTVVCIMLYLLYGMSAKQAFEYCQAVHDLRTCPVEVGSPQTQSQRQQVVRVIAALMHEHEMRRSALEAAAEEEASVRRFHAELQQQVLDREKAQAAANAAKRATQPSPTQQVASQQQSANGVSSHTPQKSANGAHSGGHGAHTGGPPLSPPAAVMKPNVVVRDTTQEHIFSMSKHNQTQGNAIPVGATKSAVNNNNHFGRKKQNNGAYATSTSAVNSPAPASAVQGKSTSFPAIQGKQAPNSVPSTPASTSALQDFNSDNSDMSTGSRTSQHSHNSHQSQSEGTPQKSAPVASLGGDSAAALLQTLQAHPPRSPPPNSNNPRAENLQRLHSRGASSPFASNSGDLHIGDVFIPPSSDEGENDPNEEDDEGFIAHAVSTMSSVGGKIPLYQHFAPSKIGTGANLSTGNNTCNNTGAASSPMQIQVSDTEDCDMDTELSATSSVRDAVSYISSTDSRPMSIVQDSPTASGAVATDVVISTMTSTVTTDSLELCDVNTPGSAVGSAMEITPPGTFSTHAGSYSAQGGDQALGESGSTSVLANGAHNTHHHGHHSHHHNQHSKHGGDSQASALDDSDSGVRGAEATSTTTTTSSAPQARAASSDAGSPKTRRLSGSKVISNAFKAGIKMFTGGGSSSNSAVSTPTTKEAKKVDKTQDKASSRSVSSDAASTASTVNVCVKSNPDILLTSLKTASNDSAVSYSTLIADSTSTANTPTSSKIVEGGLTRQQLHAQQQQLQVQMQGQMQQVPAAASAAQRSAHSVSGVEPTPPKGSAPAQRGPLKGGRS